MDQSNQSISSDPTDDQREMSRLKRKLILITLLVQIALSLVGIWLGWEGIHSGSPDFQAWGYGLVGLIFGFWFPRGGLLS